MASEYEAQLQRDSRAPVDPGAAEPAQRRSRGAPRRQAGSKQTPPRQTPPLTAAPPRPPAAGELRGSSAFEYAMAPAATAAEEQRATAALARLEQLLVRRNNWVIRDAEVIEALDLIRGLPAPLQGIVIDRLRDDAFANLIAELPAARREQLETLVAQASRPDRKLRLWAAQHRSRADNLASSRGTPRARANAASTAAEIDEEVEFLKRRPGGLDQLAIERAIARKRRELDIEAESGIELTAQSEPRERSAVFEQNAFFAGERIAWSERELGDVEVALGLVPPDHLLTATNIHRDDFSAKFPEVTGDHKDGTIRMLDRSADIKGFGRHQGQRIESVAGNPGPVTLVIETLAHEIGHAVHTAFPDVFATYQALAGWERLSVDQLVDRVPEGLARLRERGELVHDGKVYLPDRSDDDGVVARRRDSVASWPAWEYAKTDPKEHFAEHYMMAVLVPDRLLYEMIEAPGMEVARVQEKMAARPQAGNPARAAELEAELAAARRAQATQRALYELMRSEVFRAPQRIEAMVKALRAKGVAEDRIVAFRQAAVAAHTPQQIDFVAGRFSGKQ